MTGATAVIIAKPTNENLLMIDTFLQSDLRQHTSEYQSGVRSNAQNLRAFPVEMPSSLRSTCASSPKPPETGHTDGSRTSDS